LATRAKDTVLTPRGVDPGFATTGDHGGGTMVSAEHEPVVRKKGQKLRI